MLRLGFDFGETLLKIRCLSGCRAEILGESADNAVAIIG